MDLMLNGGASESLFDNRHLSALGAEVLLSAAPAQIPVSVALFSAWSLRERHDACALCCMTRHALNSLGISLSRAAEEKGTISVEFAHESETFMIDIAVSGSQR